MGRIFEGVIKSWKSHFIVEVELEGELYDCFISNGIIVKMIGNKQLPCLVSFNTDNSKKKYRVEAVSFDNNFWITNNQTIIKIRTS